MAKDSAVRIEIGRSFHQLGTVQEKVRESDLVPLWDGISTNKLLLSGFENINHTENIQAQEQHWILFHIQTTHIMSQQFQSPYLCG